MWCLFKTKTNKKYIIMSTLRNVQNQEQENSKNTCNICQTFLLFKYHCTVCNDFDLCMLCYKKHGHPHKMEKSDGLKWPKSIREMRLSFFRVVESLVHASHCTDANCLLKNCQEMKQDIRHIKTCKRKSNDGCSLCNRLFLLCYCHARRCRESTCRAPYCSMIKRKRISLTFKRRHIQRRLLTLHSLHSVANPAGSTSSVNANAAGSLGLLQPTPQGPLPTMLDVASPAGPSTSFVNANAAGGSGMPQPSPQMDVGPDAAPVPMDLDDDSQL